MIRTMASGSCIQVMSTQKWKSCTDYTRGSPMQIHGTGVICKCKLVEAYRSPGQGCLDVVSSVGAKRLRGPTYSHASTLHLSHPTCSQLATLSLLSKLAKITPILRLRRTALSPVTAARWRQHPRGWLRETDTAHSARHQHHRYNALYVGDPRFCCCGLALIYLGIVQACDPQNFEPNLALNLEISDLINSKKGSAYGHTL